MHGFNFVNESGDVIYQFDAEWFLGNAQLIKKLASSEKLNRAQDFGFKLSGPIDKLEPHGQDDRIRLKTFNPEGMFTAQLSGIV